jgi:Xaa-Pro aminopeptidase
MNACLHRQKLFEALPSASVALIASGEEQIRNRDVDYPFRAESDFIYLTGFHEPDSVLVLIKSEVLANTEQDTGSDQAWLFLRPSDPEKEVWNGRRLGVDAAVDNLCMDQAFAIDELDDMAMTFLTQARQVYFSFGQLDRWNGVLADWLKALKSQVRKGVEVPTSLCDLDSLLHEQRLIKSAEEIEMMRQAAQLSVQGHLAAMRATRVGGFEYQLQSALEYRFRIAGSERTAFNTIVAGGENACILHYTDNRAVLNDGDLVLVDAGAEWQGYAGDISHTFPVNGRFTEPQKRLYELVLAAQEAAISAVQPGRRYGEMHEASSLVITKGLLELGILTGRLEEAIKEQKFKRFFMHGTGHWLGLDVHDVGRYKIDGEWRVFEAGMVVTVEPGIYIPKGLPDVDIQWQGIGIRIEDDVLVTSNGAEVLTKGLPRTVEEIEQWMQAR